MTLARKLLAADIYRDRSKPDGHIKGFPYWHGWVIVQAFLAGIRWHEDQINTSKRSVQEVENER